MKTFWIIFITLIGTQGFAQVLNQKSMDTKKHSEILIGYCDRQGLTSSDFDSAYQAEYGSYTPDTSVMRQLSPGMKDVAVKIIMGTWCGDSKEQVPRLYKILDLLKFDDNRLTVVCVDRAKTAPGVDLSQLQISLVPTVIFYRSDKEIGRIIETPKASLEKDMLMITGKAD